MARMPLVSSVCPTYGRHNYHKQLYNTFAAQTYPAKNLWVLDDSHIASPFFSTLSDPRVHYIWSPVKRSIGTKRNILIDMASGDVVMSQDDDDLYKHDYMATMVGRLGKHTALTKLSVWDAKSAYDGSVWRWDTRFAGPTHYAVSGSAPPARVADGEMTPEALNAQLWGYGFSYVFTKNAWSMVPFKDINLGEDLDFVSRLRNIAPCTHQADIPDSVLHTVHPKSTSNIYPQQCIGWCRPVSQTTPTQQRTPQTGSAQAVPSKISLVPGMYQATALVKNSHTTHSLTERASGYGVQVMSVRENCEPPPGLPPPKPGYRYVSVKARIRVPRTMRSAVPWPFSIADETRLVALGATR